jgi:selenocysteine lyase/cysteine desulfurase
MKLDVTRLRPDPATGLINPDQVRRALRPETSLIAIVHGSNVTGTLQPIREIGKVARAANVPFLVDAAQSLGHVPLNVTDDMIDLLAFPGHKGLLGPLGTGALYIRPGVEKQMATVREGGTGSISEQDVQPEFMPDRFEPGSHNAIGLIGLSAGVQWLLDQGIDKLWAHEQALMKVALDGFNDEQRMPGLTLFGPKTLDNRCGVFSIRIDGIDSPQALSDMLENNFGILTRSGIHCAPLAHKTFGTHTMGGMTRLSFGPFLKTSDVQLAVNAISQICHETAARPASR